MKQDMDKNKLAQKTKILILSHISEYVGGAEKSLLDVVDSWSAKNAIEPVFILKKPVGSMKQAIDKRRWRHYGVEYTFWSEGNPPKTSEKKYVAALKNTRAIQKIEKIIEREKPDVVITNSVVCPWAAIAAYYQKIPHVWFVREYGDLDHGRIFEIGRSKTLEDVGNLSELVVANSKTLSDHLSKYIDQYKLTVLYNPFDISDLKKKSEAAVNNPYKYKDSLKLIITGSPAPSKGQLETIQAVARLNQEGFNVELCLVGANGPKDYRNKLVKTIKDNKIGKKVHRVGHQVNPLAFTRLADIGIMASRKEAFGRVTFEYMAVGKPVIGSDSGATPELVANGENGLLFKPGDVGSLADCIKKYLENKELIEKHGQRSKIKAEEMLDGRYNSDEVYKKIIGLIQSDSRLQRYAPINYTHKWLEYPQLANDFIIETGKISIKKLFYKRARTKLGVTKRKLRRTAKKTIKNKV